MAALVALLVVAAICVGVLCFTNIRERERPVPVPINFNKSQISEKNTMIMLDLTNFKPSYENVPHPTQSRIPN